MNEIVEYHNDLHKLSLAKFSELEQNLLFGVLVKCGALVTGWFVFDKEYNDDPTIKILDMQQYILNKNDD